ncbi:hypothetical protein V5O48_011888 [Marasmius crinis-equi]|uniref:Aminoglycoside phosphotransferase domain-containing protein n=1 Tax=Marasmius crinis-equi TaxID=585013 RepID=A0ABR3F4B9_9AGAR
MSAPPLTFPDVIDLGGQACGFHFRESEKDKLFMDPADITPYSDFETVQDSRILVHMSRRRVLKMYSYLVDVAQLVAYMDRARTKVPVPRVHKWGYSGNCAYILMELVYGWPANELALEKQMPYPDILTSQVKQIVRDLASVGLSHCDLRPRNIIVDSRTWQIEGLVDWDMCKPLVNGCEYAFRHLECDIWHPFTVNDKWDMFFLDAAVDKLGEELRLEQSYEFSKVILPLRGTGASTHHFPPHPELSDYTRRNLPGGVDRFEVWRRERRSRSRDAWEFDCFRWGYIITAGFYSNAMSKRKLVSAAQHAEYSQYASLLRSLRTNDILDVTSQLSQHVRNSKGKQKAWEDDLDVDEGEDEDDEVDTLIGSSQAQNSKADTEAGPSTSPPPSPSPSRTLKRKRSSTPISCTKRKRDGWTRWPLLMKDVPVPEWVLEDEIEHLVAQRDDEDDDDEDLDEPEYLAELTLTTTHLLHSVFSTLSEFTPARAPSLQNRLEPIGWEGVLDAFALYRSFDSGGNDADATKRIIESVRNRIQAVYVLDPSPVQIISAPEDPPPLPHTTDTSTLSHRTQLLTSSRTDLSSSLTRYGVSDDSLFNIPVINENSTVQRSTRRKRGRPPAASYDTGVGTGRKRRTKAKKEEKEVEPQVESANHEEPAGEE